MVRRILLLLLIAGALWHVYGDTYQSEGATGVWQAMRSDIEAIRENPTVRRTVETVNREIQSFFTDQPEERNQSTKQIDKPELTTPSEHSFSIHNVEIGDSRTEVENQVGKPKRSSLNEYGLNWIAYHKDYQNFFMVAYDEQNKVAGLYTNQDLVSSNKSIQIGSPKDPVQTIMPEPLDAIQKGFTRYQVQNKEEYDVFSIEDQFITIFYDKHEENTVTAIQILTKELEDRKKGFFAEPNSSLKQGFEYQLFDLTNAARVERGLQPLVWSDAVRTTARDHSDDMAENNYFSHTNLQGESPFDRLKEDNIRYRMAGENLAVGQSSSIFAHEGLMNSLGHRENILKPGFTYLAVGVAFNEEAQPYYTENFITK